MKWFKFAFRNVLRNRRRSLVTIILVTIGVAAILSAQGFSSHTNHRIQGITVDRIGNLIVSHPEYFERDEVRTMELGIVDYNVLMNKLRGDERVKYVFPELRLSGMVSNGDKTSIFRAIAVDHTTFDREHGGIRFVSGGALSEVSDMPLDPEVILGKDLAESLNVDVGDYLTLMSTTTYKGINAVDFRVVGTVDIGSLQGNRYIIYLNLSDAQELVDTDAIHTLSIHLHDFEKTEIMQHKFTEDLVDLKVTHWSEEAEAYDRVKALFGGIFGVMTLIVMIMVFFSVSNTMSQTVVERTREIGTLAALGTGRSVIVFNFVTEAIIIALIGSSLGVVVASVVGIVLSASGAELPPGPGFTNPIPISFLISTSLMVKTSISLIVACAAASWFSARRGVKQPIVDALTHV